MPVLCSGRRFVERHVTEESHDCVTHGCTHHVCKPYAASSVRSLHAILGACGAAVRWGWLTFNPVTGVRLPSKPRPQPRPPSSDQTANATRCGRTVGGVNGVAGAVGEFDGLGF